MEELNSIYRDLKIEERYERRDKERIDGFLYTYNRGHIRVLVPGAGLGRLAYDIARQGIFYNNSLFGSQFHLICLLCRFQVLAVKVSCTMHIM